MNNLSPEQLCALCAQDGNSCCQTDPAHAHLTFPLFDAEWERMVPFSDSMPAIRLQELASIQGEAARPSPELIREQEANLSEFVQALHALFPLDSKKIDTLFPAHGKHYRLRTTPTGACVFLSETGCVLPRSARPWYCKLFPAWIIGKEHTLFTSPTCLIAKNAHSVTKGHSLLDTTPKNVQSLYAQLRADWGLDN